MPIPDSDNGLRVHLVNDPAIFIVIDNKLHHIPDEETYLSIIGTDPAEDIRNGVVREELSIEPADVDAPISHGAGLARGSGQKEVWFVNQFHKRHVTTEALRQKYFPQGTINTVPVHIVEAIPTALPPIDK